MKRTIMKTYNNQGQKCKTYIYDIDNAIVFHKFTLIPNKIFVSIVGGETIIKKTNNYILTFHWFSIKKETLLTSLISLDLI